MSLARALPLLVTCWALAVGTGMALLWRYKMTAAPTTEAPGVWPEASSLSRDRARPTLVMLAHPQCPCTRASLGELSRLVSELRDRVAVVVAFVEAGDRGFPETDVTRLARAIPGAAIHVDPDGREATLFGARASGEVLLYDAGGRLQFHGGITGARGHLGDNAGERRVATLVRGGRADRAQSPVFGCALFSPAAAAR